MNGKGLINLLFESSSLRLDLKGKAERVLTDILDNVNLDDELVARVSDETYKFIKDYKGV